MGRRERVRIPDRYREGEDEKLNKHWQVFFLDKLAETSNVSQAAAEVGANPARAYRLRREDPEFARKWSAALLEGYEHLEMETLRRLREGVPADGPKFDIANALRLLTLHRETVAKEKARQGKRDKATVLAGLNAKLDRMRERRAAAEKLLQEQGVIDAGRNARH